jgi:hypothetical protein
VNHQCLAHFPLFLLIFLGGKKKISKCYPLTYNQISPIPAKGVSFCSNWLMPQL